jgi:hypothetical protein
MIEFRNGKYEVIVNGKVVARTASKYYAKQKDAELSQGFVAESERMDEYPINDRFDYAYELTRLVASKKAPSAIITGEGGLGKTHTVLKALNDSGLTDITDLDGLADGTVVRNAFKVIKGYSTPKGLYINLFENKNNIVVFDDCDSVLKDPDAVNILKGALDSYSKRVITWSTAIRDDDIPRSFRFEGGVIFVSNMTRNRIDQAVRSRSINVDLSMTTDQKLDRMEVLIAEDEFLPEISTNYKQLALEIIREVKDKAREINLRTLISVTKVLHSDNPRAVDMAKYMICN